MSGKPSRSTAAALVRDQRGSVYVEYLVILCLVSVGAALAILACGALLFHLLHYQQAAILFPLP